MKHTDILIIGAGAALAFVAWKTFAAGKGTTRANVAPSGYTVPTGSDIVSPGLLSIWEASRVQDPNNSGANYYIGGKLFRTANPFGDTLN